VAWSACGHCEYCRTGWETLCESQQNGGYSVNGSFGSYMLVNAAYAPRIPDTVDPLEIAPILCAGVTVYKGLKVTDTRPDSGWRSPASADSATSPCSTRGPWGCAWSPTARG
jgi:D-arabinose 1-dehydrogenase-like Zn-dependent alcohol dehydrogenase